MGICDDNLNRLTWMIEGRPVVESALAICIFATFDVARRGGGGDLD